MQQVWFVHTLTWIQVRFVSIIVLCLYILFAFYFHYSIVVPLELLKLLIIYRPHPVFCILSTYLNAVFGWRIQRVLFMSFSRMSWFSTVLSCFYNTWYALLTLTSSWSFVKEVVIWIPQFIVHLICTRSILILSSFLRPGLSQVCWQQFFVFSAYACYMYCVSSWFVHMFGEENKLSNSILHKYSTARLLPPF